MRAPLLPRPAASPRPWAGTRLGDGVGERWLAGPGSLVETADGTRTLDELAAEHGEALVGARAMALLGARFPLLTKLIDAADWLSLQVHPDDALAVALHGEGSVGKAEAWLVLDAEPGRTLITGPAAGFSADALRERIAAGTLGRDGCIERPAIPGDTFMLHAGTLHAVGAGIFLFEIEQPSDLTYRVSDWGRPAVPGRSLHVTESLRAVDPGAHAVPAGGDWRLEGGALRVPQFVLELVRGDAYRAPAGGSVEVVTPLRGEATLMGDGWSVPLPTFGTAVVPAAVDAYRIEAAPEAVIAVGSIP